MILVDVREPDVVERLLERPHRREDLQFFDYLVTVEGSGARLGLQVPVERKTAEDFVTSIEDGRIFTQAAVMSAVAPVSFIVVEGSPLIALMERRMPRKAYLGALSSLALKTAPYGVGGRVSVVVVDTYHDTAMFLDNLDRQLEEIARGDTPRVPVNRSKTLEPDPRLWMVSMLQGVPGIGPELALRIVDRFGSMERLVKAHPNEILSIPGIGEKVFKRLWAVLHGGD